VLAQGETLSMFIEDSLKKHIAYRQSERDFIARGMASAARAKESGVYYSGESVLAELREMLNRKKQAHQA
jgi:predicted transcriptional regulator